MGGKLQLVLGLILFNSVWIVSCTSSEINNSTPQEQKNDDKITNAIHKQPKTETTEIKYVNNNTPINIKNVSDTKSESESIDEQYEKQNEVEKDTYTENVSVNKKDATPKRREDNGRSIDIEKYISPEFQNNEFTLSVSSDTEKYLEEPFSFKTSTKGLSEFDRTTPKTSMFTKFTEPVQKLEQEYGADQEFRDDHIDLENNHDDEDDHYDKEDDDHDSSEHDIDNITVDKKIERSESVPTNISLSWEMKISKEDPDKNKTKNLKSFTVVKYRKVDYVTHFNDTKVFVSEPKGDSEVLNSTTIKTPTSTTRKNNLLTKPPTDKNNSHLLSNKIETETIKAINLVTTEIPTTKKLEGDEGNKEQTAQDTQITRAVTTLNDQNGSTETVTNETTTHKNIERVTIAVDQTEIISDNKTFGGEETTLNTTERIVMNNTSTTETSAQTTTEITTEPETTTLETTSFPSTTQSPQEDIYVGTDVPTTADFEITTLFEARILKDEDVKGKSTNSQVTDVSITTIPTTIPDISPSTTETQTSDRSTTTESVPSTTSSFIKSEVTTNFTMASDTPFELSTATTETTEATAATEPSIDIMSDGTTTLPETTSENVNVIIKMTEAIKEMRRNETTTTTENMEPQTQLPTTGVNFVHVETTGTNQTTFIPETLSPSFNYPITSSDDRERVAINYDVKSGSGETTTTEESEETTGTSSATENIVIDDDGNNKGKIAAIAISAVGAICLVILAGLLYVVKKRQRKFNYKQRCRPVSLDDYSVDNLSVYNSVRRKDIDRQSKRSYGNPAFDDPSVTSHPLNFPALAKFATNVEDMKAEFEEIPQITARVNELPEGCESKNRYANVIPLPETRVYLKTVEGVPNSDYINANYVTGPKNTRGYYIACQAPKQNTVDDFWRMIWEQQCKVVLMITQLFENGVEKCVDYLPPSEVLDCHRLFGDFQVTLKKREAKEKYIISSIQLKNMVSNSWRDVTHFWYLGWPEKGVPSEANSLIAFLIEARSYMKAGTLEKNSSPNDMRDDPSQNELNPVVVHCSPGTGRTGVVIACDIAIREFEKIRLVDIPKIVYRIRRDRANAVQTKEQYMFIYKVISLYATKLTGGALDSF